LENSPIIKLQNVTIRRGENLALDSVSFDLFPKTILGLVGPNGAGKTTLLQIILGELKPDSGEVFILGKPRNEISPKEFPIGYLPQRHDFDRNIPITVFDAVAMSRYGKIGLFKNLSKDDKGKILLAIETIGMSRFIKKPVKELSGGQLQRVLIARALAMEPKALLLDEPDAGIDSETADAFMDSLSELREKFSLGIILVSHDIGTITRHADSVACLNVRLHFHGSSKCLGENEVAKTFGSGTELIVHGLPARNLEKHFPGHCYRAEKDATF
jgi:zinc transport system ATP-binding protein